MLKAKFRSNLNKLHIFGTDFMEKLSPTRTSSEVIAFNYSEVSRHTHHRTRKNINLFQKDMVLIPINYHNQHWTLAAIYPKKREVAYYDSMHSNRTADDYLDIIQRYLMEESHHVTDTFFNPIDWTFHQPSVPKQTNCHDCGIYLLLYSHLIVHGLPIESINPRDVPLIRETICNALLHSTVPSTTNGIHITSDNSGIPVSNLSTRSNTKRKTAFQGSYNEDHIERKQRNQPIEYPCPYDLHLHPKDDFANKRAGIATSEIAQGGLGLFVLRDFDIGEIIGYMFGGVKLTRENLHLHLPSLYAFFDDHNNIFIDPYDPNTKYISCSAAYANDNIQQPDLNNAEFVTFTDGTVALRATKKIFRYEEVGTSYGPDHWKTLIYPLSLLIAQQAYNKEHDPE
jgi:hypothetical protein